MQSCGSEQGSEARRREKYRFSFFAIRRPADPGRTGKDGRGSQDVMGASAGKGIRRFQAAIPAFCRIILFGLATIS